MTRIQFWSILGFMTFATLAVASLVFYLDTARARGYDNSVQLCRYLEEVSGKPCPLDPGPKPTLVNPRTP